MDTACIILAAGKGTRFGSDRPKQFVNFRGLPLYRHSLEAFEASSVVDEFVLVVDSERVYRIQDEVQNEYEDLLRVVQGGDSRRGSVYSGLSALAVDESPDQVFVHDAARPGLEAKFIKKLHEVFQSDDCTGDAVIPGIELQDTVKQLAPGGEVEQTLNRDRLRRIQTPQLFDFSRLYSIHDNWPQETDIEVTDDASMIEHEGGNVVVIEGLRSHLKVTYPGDLEILDTLLENESKPEPQ